MKLLQLVLNLFVCLAFSISSSGYAKECYKVLYVVDGDTIVILYHTHKEKVGLLGIDTPESRRNRRATYQARKNRQDVETIIRLGKEAKKHLKELLKGHRRICLAYDQNNTYSGHRNRYGKLLAYLFTLDGKFINKLMLEDGYAYLLTQYPRVLRQALGRDYGRRKKTNFWEYSRFYG